MAAIAAFLAVVALLAGRVWRLHESIRNFYRPDRIPKAREDGEGSIGSEDAEPDDRRSPSAQ